jgi:hypothetical protein
MKMMFDKNDYRSLENGETYENKYVILSTGQFKPEYQNAKNQLFYAESGFGCFPDKMGGKIFGRLFDERFQTRREYVLGVATEEAIEAWENYYGISRDVFKEGE